MGLITKAGSGAIQVEDEGGEEQEPAQPKRSGRKQPTEPGEPRAGSKQAKIVGLMQRKSGATLDDLVAATRLVAAHHPGGADRLAEEGV